MSYQLEATIHKIFDTEAKTDKFKSRDVVCVTNDQYPQYIKIQFVQDRCELLDSFREGDEVRIFFDLRGKEWQEKYFTNLQAWKIERTSVVVGRSEPKKADKPDGWDAVQEPDAPF